MSYAQLQDLIDRYGADEITELTDQSGTGQLDATVAATALSDASEIINGFLGSRYQLPLTPVPALVTRWACDIARFFIWKNEASDTVKMLYTSALSSLAAARDGDLELQVAATPAAVVPDVIIAVGPGRRFGRLEQF